MHSLGILEQYETLLYFIFCPPFCPKIVSAPLRELIFIDAANLAFKKSGKLLTA